MLDNDPIDESLLQDNTAIIQFLEETRLFANVEHEFLTEIASMATLKRFYKGDVVLQEGTPNEHLYLLMKGALSIYSEGQYIYTLRRSGDIVGEMSLIKQTLCSATVTADDDVVETIFLPDISAQLNENPQIVYKIFTFILVDKLKKTTMKAQLYEENLKELQSTLKALEIAKNTAEAATKTKNDFLTLMTHEIRTPLNIILGMTNLLMESDLEDELKEYVQMSKKWEEHLLGLVNQVQEISYLDNKHSPVEQTYFDLEELIQRLTSVFSKKALEKGLAFETSVASGTFVELVGDPAHTHQILVNVLDNAVKFTKAGKVVFQVSPASTGMTAHDYPICFKIIDTGIGMTPEQLEVIFEPFTQIDPSTTKKHEGAGLGLTVAKRIVQFLGGELRVESHERQGSSFYCNIPFRLLKESRRYVQGGETLMNKNKDIFTPQKKPYRVLLAEDNIDNTTLIQIYLKGQPYQLDIAMDGKKAVQLFQSHEYDVVLMDIQMPYMDGYEATRAIRTWEREQECSKSVPIVALTAHSVSTEASQSFAAGCTMHLLKPINEPTLLSVLSRFCSGKIDKAGHPEHIQQHAAYIPTKLKEVVPYYLEKKQQDVRALQEAVKKRDFNEVHRIGHSLRGSGGAYGFAAITEIGAALQRSSKSMDMGEVQKWVHAFVDYLENVEIFYE